MSSDFLRDLEALIGNHRSALSPASDDRILRSITALMTEMTRAIISELRSPGRTGTMIRYRPDIDRGGRTGTMIRYRPDVDRGDRAGTMIRYRPDVDRESRSGAMIRYRPDWDREPAQGGETPNPQRAAAGFLEPMLRDLAERLGPEEAQKVISETLAGLGLSQGTSPKARRKPPTKKTVS